MPAADDLTRPVEAGFAVRSGLQAGRPLGDVVAAFTQATGIDQIASAYSGATGNDCGCDERREALNRLFPNTPL